MKWDITNSINICLFFLGSIFLRGIFIDSNKWVILVSVAIAAGWEGYQYAWRLQHNVKPVFMQILVDLMSMIGGGVIGTFTAHFLSSLPS